MKKNIKYLSFVVITFLTPILVHAAIADFLILQDIGTYKFITETKNPLTKKTVQIPGYTTRNAPGVLAGCGHFDLDHDDATYETDYESDVADLGVEVQVTSHSGSDSDKWLLHELDKEFRTYYGIPDPSYIIKTVDGSTIYTFGSGGWDYRWISGKKVIVIDYHDSQMMKSEPTEIVQAYLVKHPSTLPATTMKELYSAANETTWVKDEMDRRLWLCDKWFYQLQSRNVEEKQVYKESVKSMNIFLDYREKYYGVKASDEKNLLASYLNAGNGTSIKAKLTQYKDWWTANKDKGISL